MNERQRTQNDAILEYLQEGNILTPLEALQRFGCFRLAARVRELRQKGHVIGTTRVKVASGVHIAEYSMLHVDPKKSRPEAA